MAEVFVRNVATSLQSGDQRALSALFSPFSQSTQGFKQELASAPNTKTFQAIAKRLIPDEIFALLVAEYLTFLRHAQLDSQDAADLTAAYKLLESTFSQVRQVLQRSEKAIYIPVVRNLTSALAHLALMVDAAGADPANTRSSAAARSLTLALNLCASGDISPKRAAVLFLANTTLRIYFHLKNPRMGTTVVSNTGEARNRLADFPKADRVEFLYYCGRMSLFERRLKKAASQLDLAWRLCSKDAYNNQRLIMIYLITARLILGVFPTPLLLQTYNLDGPYSQLIQALKRGNFKEVQRQLNLWKSWHLQRGNYLLLLEKLEVICWRNLIRTLLILTDNPASNPGKSPTLKLAALVAAAQVAFDDSTLDVDDIECMVISLIDQNYLKAYVWHATGQIVFQKGPTFGFPPVSTVQLAYE